MRLVIIGLGAGGFAAAFSARKIDKSCQITIIDPKPYDLLHPCGIPYALEGKTTPEKLTQQLELDKMNMTKITGSAHTIDPHNKKVIIDSEREIAYDKLIIATGALPLVPPIPGIESAHTLNTIESVSKILAQLTKNTSCVVIGGGAIGLECAFALHKKAGSCTVLEREKSLMPRSLDHDMAGLVEDYLSTVGIRILCNEQVTRVSQNVLTTSQGELTADLIICACGFTPNGKLADKAGLKMSGQAIKVNNCMQTSHPDIYAVGDCAETYSTLTKSPLWVALATTAFRQGIIAASHALGNHIEYPGTLSTFVSKIGDMEVAASGLTEQQAEAAQLQVVNSRLRGKIIPHWIADQEPLTLKILVDKQSTKLVGAQAVGRHGALERINVLSCAMRAQLKVRDLLDLELGYCPPLSETYDLINRTAEIALKKCIVAKG
jgi:NADH oxidase (H2O2-forming)